MSCVYKGEVINSELSMNSRGGTEMMRDRLLKYVDSSLLKDVAIHFSRPRQIYNDVKNVLYCHDLAEDPENRILSGGGWRQFDHFVFVSSWQRDQYIMMYNIPYSMCSVIYNAVEKEFSPREKNTDTIRFIYHTTPHRGLELLIPIFDSLSKIFNNIHLDVFSSFKIYGWEKRDEAYTPLYQKIKEHPHMTYHGAKSNEEVLKALDNAHVFLYPCTWKETSCIALIEAIKSQVICIHPNYGALPETAANATIMYDYNEDVNLHANFAFSIAVQLLQAQKENPKFFNQYTFSDRFALARNNVESFKTMWNKVLRDLEND